MNSARVSEKARREGDAFNAELLQQCGFDLPFAAAMIEAVGMEGLRSWAEAAFELANGFAEDIGLPGAQMLVGIAASWNACQWCSYGHVYAANLVLLRDEGQIYDLDEQEIFDLQELPDEEVMKRLESVFQGHPHTWTRIQRLFELKLRGDSPVTDVDHNLVALIAALDLSAECSAVSPFSKQIPPLEPSVSRDTELMRRYAELRSRKAA